ncbi:MAG: metallophosphoesterase [Clostridia bacterium]|nr:metallophosphoesterase [Clostridia bacterium]
MANEKTLKQPRKLKGWQIFLITVVAIIVIIALAFGTCFLIGFIGRKSNLEYCRSVEAIEYTNQLTPTWVEAEYYRNGTPITEEEYFEHEGDADYTSIMGHYKFVTDGDFKITQITDVHIGAGFLSTQKDNWALKAVETLIRKEKPDFVYVTGDIGWPVPYSSGTINNEPPVEMFSALMESLGVYWTFVFGNHDTEVYSLHDRAYISNWYVTHKESNPHCLYVEDPHYSGQGRNENYSQLENGYGYGNQIITIEKTDGSINKVLMGIDSGSYEKGFLRDYDHIHKVQIDWYYSQLMSLETKYGYLPDSMLFFHIPLEEFRVAWENYVENGRKDNENIIVKFGDAGESGRVVYSGINNSELFEEAILLGSTKAIFCGHDHLNNFSLLYNGLGSPDGDEPEDRVFDQAEKDLIIGEGRYIRLTYGMSIDYIAYPMIASKSTQRGATSIIVKPSGSFEVYSRRLIDDTLLEDDDNID